MLWEEPLLSSFARGGNKERTGESVTFSHVKANEEEISQGKIHETCVRQASSLACRVARKGGSKATEHIQPQPDVGGDPGLQFEPGKQRVASHISDFAAPLQKAMAQHHMGDLDKRINRLASSGLP